MLLLFNGHHEPVGFTLPPTGDGDEWHLLLDTATDNGQDGNQAKANGGKNKSANIPKIALPGNSVQMQDRSMAVFVMQRTEHDQPK